MYVHRPLYAQDRFLKESNNGLYGACVSCIDWSVNVLINELKQLQIYNNTLIIFTSDNGSRGAEAEGCSNKPLRGSKGSAWEGGFRVPCIISWPDKIPAGRVSDEIISSIDFLPTVASLTGTEPQSKNKIDGLDISEFLFQKKPSPRDEMLFYRGKGLEAIRKGKYKLHLYKDNKLVNLLYDLDSDIGETVNISEKHPGTVIELTSLTHERALVLGDSITGISGNGIRPHGRVQNPRTLTTYNISHPYIEAMYDSGDFG